MALPPNCTRWSFGLITSADTGSELSTFNITVEDIDPEPIISDAVMDEFNIYFNLLIRGSIAVFGVCANVINMVVFFKLGLKDSNSVGLMALSFTDFVMTSLDIAGTICFIWGTFLPVTDIDPVDFEYVCFGWFRDMAYLISGWITTLLSVERCVCVISPFRVRQIFTRTRSVIAIVIVYIVNIGVHMPVFLSQWLAWAVVDCKVENGSMLIMERLKLHTSDDRDKIHVYIDIANGAVLPIPSQTIVVVSVILMIYGLHASSKVRKNAVGGDEDKTGKSKLSSKESRLVKVVMFLAIILAVCNIPRFLAVYAKNIFKEISYGKTNKNLYIFMWNLSAFAQAVNSSVNIFVHLVVNSNFRQKFKELFGINSKSIPN